MSAHRRALGVTVALAAACMLFAGAGLAGTSSISGTVPNGGCDAAKPVPVSGPSRIEVQVSSTAADNNAVVAAIVSPSGKIVASGTYDTPSGGAYSVRICHLGSSMDPPQMQYTGVIGTGPAGQPVLQGPPQPQPPADNGGVAGARVTLKQAANGRGAIMTHSGLAWFTLHSVNGKASLRVYDPTHRTTQTLTGLRAAYGSSVVNVTGHSVKFVLVRNGASSRIMYTSPRFKASGKVVRGSFAIIG